MRAPRACGDDPKSIKPGVYNCLVLPAHAGMIPKKGDVNITVDGCSPRMRG